MQEDATSRSLALYDVAPSTSLSPAAHVLSSGVARSRVVAPALAVEARRAHVTGSGGFHDGHDAEHRDGLIAQHSVSIDCA